MINYIDFNGVSSAEYNGYTEAYGPNFTIEAWVMPTSTTQVNYSTILIRGNGTTGNGLVIFGGNIGFRSQHASGLGVTLDAFSVTNYPVNVWTHIALTVSNNTNATYYRNGELVRTVTVSPSISTIDKLSIIDWNNGYNTRFKGSIHDLRLWTYARTQEEIKSTMYQYIPRNTYGLALNFRLNDIDEAIGDDAKLDWYNKTSRKLERYDNYSKIMVKKDGKFIKYDGSDWIEVVDNINTLDDFLNNCTPLNYLDETSDDFKLNELDGEYSFVFHSSDSAPNGIAIAIDKEPQILVSKRPYSLAGIKSIKKFYVTSSNDNDAIKILLSTDGGLTWLTYNGNWIVVDDSDIANVGFTTTLLNSLNNVNLMFFDNKDSLMFKFYFPNTTASLLDFNMNVDNEGNWLQALPGEEYRYKFTNNKTLRVDLFKSGDYKIVFPPVK